MSRAAIRYAKAVLSVAQDQKTTAEVYKDMQDILATVENSQELQFFLSSPLIKNEVKYTTVLEVFKTVGAQAKKLFEVLITNKRIAIVADVAAQYIRLYDQSQHTQVAQVTTAIPMTAGLEAKVLAKVKELTGNDATLEHTIDESIIGGFILRVGDLQYNASVQHKLTSLQRELRN